MMGVRAHAAAAFGAVTILYSASHAVFPGLLPPLAPLPTLAAVGLGKPPSKPGLARIVETFLKEQQGEHYVPPEQREKVFRNGMIRAVLAQWAVVVVGLAAGALLLLRRRAGRWIALGLYAAVLGATLLQSLQFVAHAGWEGSFRTWRMMAQVAPRWIISMLLDLVVPTLALAYLAYGAFAARRNEVTRPHG